MATAWARARSLSCKSNAVADDVYVPPPPPMSKKQPPPVLQPSKSRRWPAAAAKKKTTSKKTKPDPPAQLAAFPPRPTTSACLPMTQLPEGHSSRRIVELIVASGWAGRADEAVVEELFRVNSTARAVARFEDARAAAMARGAAAGDARCAADGNETMRFQCRAAEDNGDEVVCADVATTKLSAVRTFAGSGAADAGAGAGGGPGRRGMLVCRVIAGRVRRAADPPSRAGEYHSVDAGGGELLVLDSRAVLPCFLVVYTVKPLERCTSRSSDAHGFSNSHANDHHH